MKIKRTIDRDGERVASYTITQVEPAGVDRCRVFFDATDLSGNRAVLLLTRTDMRKMIGDLERAIGWAP